MNNDFMNKEKKFILSLGGVTKVAAHCGVTKGAVSLWHVNQKIPKGWLKYFEEKFPEEYKKAYESDLDKAD